MLILLTNKETLYSGLLLEGVVVLRVSIVDEAIAAVQPVGSRAEHHGVAVAPEVSTTEDVAGMEATVDSVTTAGHIGVVEVVISTNTRTVGTSQANPAQG